MSLKSNRAAAAVSRGSVCELISEARPLTTGFPHVKVATLKIAPQTMKSVFDLSTFKSAAFCYLFSCLV